MKTNKKFNFNKLLIISLLGLVLSATSCTSKIASTRNNIQTFQKTTMTERFANFNKSVAEWFKQTDKSLDAFCKKVDDFNFPFMERWNTKKAPVVNTKSERIITKLKPIVNTNDLSFTVTFKKESNLDLEEDDTKTESKFIKVKEKIAGWKSWIMQKYTSLKTKKAPKDIENLKFVGIKLENEDTSLLTDYEGNNPEIIVDEVTSLLPDNEENKHVIIVDKRTNLFPDNKENKFVITFNKVTSLFPDNEEIKPLITFSAPKIHLGKTKINNNNLLKKTPKNSSKLKKVTVKTNEKKKLKKKAISNSTKVKNKTKTYVVNIPTPNY